MKRAGKKTLLWNKVRRELKTRFAAVGITRCEIKSPICWVDDYLSFAHAKKRRFLKPEELNHCVLACGACHTKIEGLPHSKMEEIVNNIIATRPVQP